MPRSGTTMLGLMLASGDEAMSCGEACSWFRVARYRPDAAVPDSFAPLKNVSEQAFHRRLMAHHNVQFVVDSSKDLDWIIDHTRFGRQHGLTVFNVLIYKSPLDISLSWWKRGNFHRWYSYYLRYHYQLIYSGVDFWTVSYDDLVDHPSKVIQTLCRATGLSYFEGKEHFWNYDHDMLGTNSRGVRDQLGKGVSQIKKPNVPPEFEPLAEQVQESAAEDRLLQHLLRKLRERDIATIDEKAPLPPHRYSPKFLSRITYTMYRALKLRWIRFRWNVLEPRFGPFDAVS